jgi:ABC-type uncharacterized transport system substrate-binding protein
MREERGKGWLRSGGAPGKRGLSAVLSLAFLLPLAGIPSAAPPPERKVLAVMSYHRGNTWQDEEREGIDSLLTGVDVTYFYLDTKRNIEDGPARAAEAFALYEKLRPDAVLAADDHAQAMFVVPYLSGKVETPVVFLGVNDDASRYGFPSENVTGILEVKHVGESLALAQILVPSLQRVDVLYKDNRSNRMNVAQMRKKEASYSVKVVQYLSPETFTEALDIVLSPEREADAFFTFNLTGLTDEDGRPMEAAEIVRLLSQATRKPLIGADYYEVESGALCGVVKTGQEQGETAARMVLDLFGGGKIGEMPITRNSNGQRAINVTTAERLGIVLKGDAVLGSTLIR